MKFISEFKEFISRGSVMDMAVGIRHRRSIYGYRHVVRQ